MSLAAVCIFAVPAFAGDKCTCSDIHKKGSGWCSPCKEGAVHTVALKSKKLFKIMQAHEVKDAAKIKCSGCKAAAEKNGKCDDCKVIFHDGKYFRSPVALALSKGKAVNADYVKCSGCKTALKDKKGGFCSGCDVGMVAGKKFVGKKLYQKAKASLAVLMKAAETVEKCGPCAVGMLTDGECTQCKVSFKEGKAVKS